MLMQMTEGLYKLTIPLPYGMREVNSYLIEGERGLTIVDTGDGVKLAVPLWESILSGGPPVEKVVLTHTHIDHVGLAKWFQERFHAPVIMPRQSYEELKKSREKLRNHTGDADEPYAFFLKHDGPRMSEKEILQGNAVEVFEPDGLIEEHQEIRMGGYEFEAIWTPGHAPDHFCYFDHENRTMLIGDHVLNSVAPFIQVWSEDAGNPLKDYFDSLDRMLTYPAELVLPGHLDPITDLQARISEIKAEHAEGMRNIQEALGPDGGTAGEIVRRVHGGHISPNRFTVEFFTALSRLTYLASIGKVRSENRGGKVIYQTIGKTKEAIV